MPVKKVAIIQARMASSRLPGKVLMEIAGKPILQYMLERLRWSECVDDVVIATTTDHSDDILEQFCRKQNTTCYRGSPLDVLDRCFQAAAQTHTDVIVRLTADCPLIDPQVLDLTMMTFLGKFPVQPSTSHSQYPEPIVSNAHPFDFTANRLPPPWKRTLPIGLDVEVCSFDALQQAWVEAHEPHQREHVMPYLYEGVSFGESNTPPKPGWYIDQGKTPRGFNIALLNHHPDYGSLRWTVDTHADLEFVREIITRFDGRSDFNWQDILSLLEKEPGLASINADVRHKTAFDVDHRSLSD